LPNVAMNGGAFAHEYAEILVGPNGLEPSTSSVSIFKPIT
jgi:hypothetical protein